MHLLRGALIWGCFSVPAGAIYIVLGELLTFSKNFFSSAFFLNFQFVPLMTHKVKPALETTTHEH